ncbi:glycosyltransferase family 2 protein [Fusibacter paucivorans]|uniref:Glycosyltransferase family 2 protein n=1 Tax=Fusibacter paucivorans TaxID=76009 RepID=A0ABS5PNJ2_9FIRM|nr:glycosyltransferase family 2 protein [Fusibacter paucivorans]MBS7526616.1 glycosyltransferase family 2 protein [Fusibacter paucivorans]
MTTVVIPNYNGLVYLKDCLEALEQQTYKDFEILVVDNGSTDGSIEYVANYYKSIRLIALDKNYGFTGAVNRGIKATDNEFVVLLNNDTIPAVDWLEALVKCIVSHADAFSCCSKMMQVQDENIIDDAGDGYTVFGWAYKGYDGASAEKANKTRAITSCCAGAAIYRRSIFNQIGYLNDDFFAYLEDVDLSLRAMRAGYKHYFCHDALLTHIGSATSGSKYNDFKVRISARNSVWVYQMNIAKWLKVINSLPYILGISVKFFAFKRWGFGNAYLAGIREGFKNKPSREYCQQIQGSISVRTDWFLYLSMWKDTFAYIKMKMEMKRIFGGYQK